MTVGEPLKVPGQASTAPHFKRGDGFAEFAAEPRGVEPVTEEPLETTAS